MTVLVTGKEEIHQKIVQQREETLTYIRKKAIEGEDGDKLTRFLSQSQDKILKTLLPETPPPLPWCLCAVGGYGREELYPYSDLDLLFLYSHGKPNHLKNFVETLLYPLWDLKYRVGHAIRTPEECIDLGRKDLTIATSLLDMRYIAGVPEFFSTSRKKILHDLFYTRKKEFVQGKLQELKRRREKYGDTAFLLEPDIKESPGGLRDIQTVHWIGKVIFGAEELRDLYRKGILDPSILKPLEEGSSHLKRWRVLLHLLANGSENRITFEYQDELAKLLHISEGIDEIPAERFMKQYYEITRTIAHLIDTALERIYFYLSPPAFSFPFFRKIPLPGDFYIYRGELYGSISGLKQHPHRIIEAFILKAKHRVRFSYELSRGLEENAHLLTRLSPEEKALSARWFREIFSFEDQAYETLREMNEWKVLGYFLPPFRHIYCRVQRDTYHVFTVDQHLLTALKVFYDLRKRRYEEEEPEITSFALQTDDIEILTFGILFHDIGKGYRTDHTEKGVEIFREIGSTLSLPQEKTDEIAFLIKNHLLLTHTIGRRDITDIRVLEELKEIVGTTKRLQNLLILTFCDLKGVNPDVWNDWKRDLLLRLYEEIRILLEHGDLFQIREERVKARKEKIIQTIQTSSPKSISSLYSFLNGLPNEFFLRHNEEEALWIFEVFYQAEREGIGISYRRGPSSLYWVTIVAHDRPGLFSLQAGAFFTGHFSILEAEGYVVKGSSLALNLFLVEPPDPIFFEIPEKKERFYTLVKQIVEGKEKPREPESLPKPRPLSRRRIRVTANTELSSDYTVFEVFCWDKPGLLYQLSRIFFENNCTIHLARIHTEGKRVTDIFYVQEISGSPLSQEKIQRLTNQLLLVAETT